MKNVAIDIGTTTVKVALFENGKKVGYYGKEYSLIANGKEVYQDSNDWVRLISEGIKSLGNLQGLNGVCISSQGITVLPVDKDGKPIGKALSWLDVSAEAQTAEIERLFGKQEIYRVTGKKLLPDYSLPKIKKLVESGVNAAKYLMPSDYIYYLMCGEYYTDYTMASGTMLFDVEKRLYDDELLGWCGVRKDNLAKPLPFGSYIGKVTKSGSEIFGLPEGTQIFLGAQDQKCSAYYCGLKEGVATVSLGTSTAISVLKGSDKFSLFSYDQNSLIYEAAISVTGAAIRWVRDLAFESYKDMDEKAMEANGNGGVTFDIDFNTGTSISGITLATTKGNIVYALYEGIARAIKSYLTEDIKEIVLFGGGANSTPLRTVIGKVTGCKVILADDVETALCGADKIIRDNIKI